MRYEVGLMTENNIFGKYKIQCKNGHVPKLILRENGKLYCAICSHRVRRNSNKENNCKELQNCVICRKPIIIKRLGPFFE